MTDIVQEGVSNAAKNACFTYESGSASGFYTPDVEKFARSEEIITVEGQLVTDALLREELITIINT